MNRIIETIGVGVAIGIGIEIEWICMDCDCRPEKSRRYRFRYRPRHRFVWINAFYGTAVIASGVFYYGTSAFYSNNT